MTRVFEEKAACSARGLLRLYTGLTTPSLDIQGWHRQLWRVTRAAAQQRKTIALVGGAGLVGRASVRALLARGDDVVVFDRHAVREVGARWVPCDVLETDVEQAFTKERPDIVVHLVAQVDPPTPQGRSAMRRLHEEGTRRVVAAANAVGAERFILCSSAVVYGARADNPVPLDEGAPVRPLSNFPYGVDKARQEDIARTFDGALVIARPAVVYAKDAKNYLTEIIRWAPGVLPAVDGCRPPLQFVHADDVGSAIAHLCDQGDPGVYNVASDGWLTYDAVARVAGLRVVGVKRRLVAPVLNRAARFLPGWARAPDYVLDQLAYPFVVSVDKLKHATGWRPVHSSESALREMLSGRARPGRTRSP